MVSLQPKLNLRVSQRQVLTPGLMQMVSVLALNKLELTDMIQTEIAENPVLEELEETVPMLDEVAGREAQREAAPVAEERRDPFEEIDFGSYFQDYLDPGFRSPQSFELTEKPSIENFLTRPGTLVDHLSWQLGSMAIAPDIRDAAEYILGNLDEDGYCAASDDELIAGWLPQLTGSENSSGKDAEALLQEGMRLVRSLDPVGVAARDLRHCLQMQVAAAQRRCPADRLPVLSLAARMIDDCMHLLGKRDLRELARTLACTPEEAGTALEYIRTLDPRPGQRFHQVDARLIEPDVSFLKRDDAWVAVLEEEHVPVLRLNRGYRKLLEAGTAEKDVRDYVKERYRSALQLMRNIEQRKNVILRTCEAIVRRQEDFLENGVESLRPMMIKDVAEEIGVHPSTVSRAVSNKYAHTPQGVFELRFFFSEGVNGPEGSGTPLLLLKRRVRKLIEEEDPRRPLTDDHITQVLQREGIDVTRRTVAKYREDMRIPSTHQRRVRD